MRRMLVRRMLVAAAVVAGLAGGSALAKEHGGKMKGQKIRFVPADQIRFQDAPGMQGIQTAQLWGDMSKGKDWGGLFKFAAGTDTGWHFHSGHIHLVMISGTLEIQPEGAEPTALQAGAFADEVANVKHRTRCTSSEDCVFFLHMESKFDFKKAQEPKAAAAK